MKKFRVALHRDYIVEIDAEDKSGAKQLTEYFLSTPTDDSTDMEREKHSFKIHGIELATNDATGVEEIAADETETTNYMV